MSHFAALYAEHAPTVRRFLSRRVGDPALVEDLTSDTFVRAIQSPTGTYSGAWLTTIARNLLLDHVKSARVRREISRPDAGDELATHWTPERAVLAVEEREARAERYRQLRTALAELTPDQQRCLELRFWDGLSVADAAVALDRRPDAVKQLQHRAINRLELLLTASVRNTL